MVLPLHHDRLHALRRDPMLSGACLLALAGGCAEWPRAANPPGEVQTTAGHEDAVSWQALAYEAPSADNDLPNGLDVASVTLGVASGAHFPGVLHGIGWDPDAVAPVAEDAACPDGGGSATAEPAGAYSADVDFWRVSTTSPGLLCVSAATDGGDVGWDLVAWLVDECGLPIQTISSDDGALGLNLGGLGDGWSGQMEPAELAVGLAAYYPDDDGRDVHYTIGVALVDDDHCPPPPPLLQP